MYKFDENAGGYTLNPFVIDLPSGFLLKNCKFYSKIVIGLDVFSMRILLHDVVTQKNVVLCSKDEINSLLLFNGVCFFSTMCGVSMFNIKNVIV
jgi:hypothetical protein